MKKVIFITIVALLGLNVVNAQSNVSFGLNGGVNIASVTGDDTEGTKSRTGFRFGAVADIGISEKFSFQPVVAISIQGWDVDGRDVKANYVVLEAKANFKVSKGLSLQVGPLAGFNVHASIDADDLTNFEGTNIGGLIGVQYGLSEKLFLNAQYDMGFTTVIPDFDIKNRNLSFSVGYFFN